MFWNNKKVLVTGHTGFKGSWLSLWLQSLGANVTGYALEAPTTPSLFEMAKVSEGMTSIIGDIRDLDKVKQLFIEVQPEIVIHLAAQPLVRYSYQEPVETYETNVMGTLNILEGIRSVDSVRSAVMITTDKCYENDERDWGYSEKDPMGGHDPYSSSKGCAELLISSYRNSYFPEKSYSTHKTAIASARAGNVIGGGDWAEDRLIPDLIRDFIEKKMTLIRNPDAVRPWQHVLEPLSGYLLLAEKLYSNGMKYADAWNFGPEQKDTQPVAWIADQLVEIWGENSGWENDKNVNHPHEANYLKLDCSKAFSNLGWSPKWDLQNALIKIVEWHKEALANKSMREFTLKQIEAYSNAS